MDQLVNILQDLEKMVLVLANMVLAVYSVISTMRARRWRQTADFIGTQLVQEEKKSIPQPKTKEKLVFASPRTLKKCMAQVKI